MTILTENVFEKAITKEDGTIDLDKVFSVVPRGYELQPQYVVPHVMNLMAQTGLSEDFIRKNFAYIPFRELIIWNDVPQEIIEENFEGVFSKLLFGFGSDESDELLMTFFRKEYSADIYDKLIGMIFQYFQNDELGTIDEDVVEEFSHILNAHSEYVSKEFILNNVHDAGYLLLTASLKRDDITTEELLERIDDITLDEITAWISEFEENDDLDPDTVFNLDNWNMLLTVFRHKANNLV